MRQVVVRHRIVFLDDNSPTAIGRICDIERIRYDRAFVAIGNDDVRSILLSEIKSPAPLIHPSATVMSSAEIGKGSIVDFTNFSLVGVMNVTDNLCRNAA